MLLEERLRNLQSWLVDALEVAELRNAETINKAKRVFLKLVCESWDDGQGDVDGALSQALETYVECSVRWADSSAAFHDDLRLSADPAWHLAEFHLLVASLLADHALSAFEKGTKKQLVLAAMLYADAVEAREHWNAIRGPAGARNPDTWRGKLHRSSLAIDEKLAGDKARKQTALRGAMAKLANDPKQVAKAGAFELWKERHAGKHPKLRTNEQFASEVMRRWPVLTSSKVICGWSARWTKTVKQGTFPSS
jgi:hypothetical protein